MYSFSFTCRFLAFTFTSTLFSSPTIFPRWDLGQEGKKNVIHNKRRHNASLAKTGLYQKKVIM